MAPTEAVSRWRAWTVTGTAAQLDQLFTWLHSHLPAGWRPATEEEAAAFRTTGRDTKWYSLDPAPVHAAVLLGIDRLRGTELRGGRVWFPAPFGNSTSIPAAWEHVVRLLESGILPAAGAVGVTARTPPVNDAFYADLPVDVQDRLRSFSDAARKTLPLDSTEAERWREFVVSAYRTRTGIPAHSFSHWLGDQGWTAEAAADLALRFFDQSLLLSRYAEEAAA